MDCKGKIPSTGSTGCNGLLFQCVKNKHSDCKREKRNTSHEITSTSKLIANGLLFQCNVPDGLLPGSDDRLADVLIPIWTEGHDTALDITVVNPLQQALVVRTFEEGDSAVAHAHKEKLRKYEARCSAEAITFLHLAVDSFGGWHKVGLQTITRLGRQLARNLGKDEYEVMRQLRQRLGVLTDRQEQCGNDRHPTFVPPDVDGYPD